MKTKSKKKHSKWIDRALVVSPYYICLCLTEKQFVKECKRLKMPKSLRPIFVENGKDGRSHFFNNTTTNRLACIVCLKPDKDITIGGLVGLLTHEAVHVWQEIKDAIGEHEPSPEFEAYAVQMINQELLEAYRELTT